MAQLSHALANVATAHQPQRLASQLLDFKHLPPAAAVRTQGAAQQGLRGTGTGELPDLCTT
jgi:hypothetical protein